ncbi:unnamed protein product [Caenorhabditis brenneri]
MAIMSKEQQKEVTKQLEGDVYRIALVLSTKKSKSSKILSDGRTMLEKMAHCGAGGSENDSGDGAGVLTAIPNDLYRKSVKEQDGSDLPPLGQYATGLLFLEEKSYKQAKDAFQDLARACGLRVIAWRKLGINRECIGEEAKETEPLIRQVFVSADYAESKPFLFEHNVYLLHNQAVISMTKQELDCHVCSLSTSTVVYKGPFTSHQLFKYYDDLSDPEYQTHLALVHYRFSTDSISSWTHDRPNLILASKLKLWQFRDNLGDSKMRGRGRTLESEYQRDDFTKFYPICQEGLADSRRLDHVIKYLVGALPETAMTILPDALEKDEDMSTEKKDFYRCATMKTEFCDEPALIALADGSSIGVALDRIDFPTAQYHFTNDGHLFLSSVSGVFNIPDESVVKKVREKRRGKKGFYPVNGQNRASSKEKTDRFET